jgi:hypothetical protein
MRELGDSLDKISIVTGLTELQLKENGILWYCLRWLKLG